MRVSQAGKLPCLLEEDVGEADEGGLGEGECLPPRGRWTEQGGANGMYS